MPSMYEACVHLPSLILLCFVSLIWCAGAVDSSCPPYVENWPSKQMAYIGESTDLICHVKGASCQVSWERNGTPLPSKGARHYTLCNGQELVLTEVAREDAGNYTCLPTGCHDNPVRLELIVFNDSAPVPPFSTGYRQCSDQTAAQGENATFCCVFYTGRLRVGDPAYTEWQKGANWTYVQEDPQALKTVRYNEETQYASCITVGATEEEAFDNYTVTCYTGIGQTRQTVYLHKEVSVGWPVWGKAVASGIGVVAIATLLLAMVYWRNRLEIRLLLKDKFGKREIDDGKLYDAFISYYWSNMGSGNNPDQRYAFDLADRLTRLGYTVYLGERDSLPGSDS